MTGAAHIIRANSRDQPLPDDSVDLVVTSPPYFALRSYQDSGVHYVGQIGDEPTPAEFVASLLEVTRECMRVLKPSGSLWVNLGDKYSQRVALRPSSHQDGLQPGREGVAKDWKASKARGESRMPYQNVVNPDTGQYVKEKSLIGIPWRYALACIDDLGLILRAEVIWSKPNGLPESVTDRVRRSHETWFHFTLNPRYYSAVDNIREAHTSPVTARGKLPGSVWTIPTQPLRVPESLGIDHFAAFPMEFPRRIIQGWSPRGVCTACGEGRQPVVQKGPTYLSAHPMPHPSDAGGDIRKQRAKGQKHQDWKNANPDTITGEACACTPNHQEVILGHERTVYDWHLWDPAPTTPGIVLDPFGGTGTTALLAKALGRHGITIDMSADYCRLAQWRTTDPDQIAAAMQVEKPAKQIEGQSDLFALLEEPA